MYIDESGFNLWLNRSRSLSARGQRAQRIEEAKRSPNFTLILSASPPLGSAHHSIFNGETTAEFFGNILCDLRQHLQKPQELTRYSSPSLCKGNIFLPQSYVAIIAFVFAFPQGGRKLFQSRKNRICFGVSFLPSNGILITQELCPTFPGLHTGARFRRWSCLNCSFIS